MKQTISQRINDIKHKLSDNYSDSVVDDSIQTLESYRTYPLKVQDEDEIDLFFLYLLLLYLKANRIKEACQLVAEQNYELDFIEVYYDDLPAVLVNNIKDAATFEDTIVDLMKHDNRCQYEDYFKIYESHPFAANYAKILIKYARSEDRRVDTLLLSNTIKWSVEKEQRKRRNDLLNGDFSEKTLKNSSLKLGYYANRLEDLSYISDYYEIRKCIKDANKEYECRKSMINMWTPEMLSHFWTSMARCLNLIERYDRTIEIIPRLTINISDATFYYHIAVAYYSIKDYESAGRYAERSVSLEPTVVNKQLLAKILMANSKYDDAETILEEIVSSIDNVIEEKYIEETNGSWVEKKTIRNLNKVDYKRKLETPYALLLLCYIFNKKNGRACAFYEEMKDRFGSTDMTLISGHIMDLKEYASEHIQEIEKEKAELSAELNQISERYNSTKETIQIWTRKLVDLQMIDDSQEISDSDWVTNYADKMEKMIDQMKAYLEKSPTEDYDKVLSDIKKKYPRLPKDETSLLATAEHMYDVFKGNTAVDFAPIMVEYARMIEILIWEYFDKTHEYDQEMKDNPEIDFKNKNTHTLGRAARCISIPTAAKKSLYQYGDRIRKISWDRNQSAHKQFTKESPQVVRVRELIWNSDFIDTLCKKL